MRVAHNIRAFQSLLRCLYVFSSHSSLLLFFFSICVCCCLYSDMKWLFYFLYSHTACRTHAFHLPITEINEFMNGGWRGGGGITLEIETKMKNINSLHFPPPPPFRSRNPMIIVGYFNQTKQKYVCETRKCLHTRNLEHLNIFSD